MNDYNTIYSLFANQLGKNLSISWFVRFFRFYFRKTLFEVLFYVLSLFFFILFIDTFFSKIYVIFDRVALIFFLITVLLINVRELITFFLMSLTHYYPKELILDSDRINSSYKRIEDIGHKAQVQYFGIFILIWLIIVIVLNLIYHNTYYIPFILPFIVLGLYPFMIIPYLLDQDDFWNIYTNSVLERYSKREKLIKE